MGIRFRPDRERFGLNATFDNHSEEFRNGMNITKLAIAASTLALGLVAWITPGKAQGPLFDTVYVNLPYSVTINDRTLQPGDYVIKELPSTDKSRVLLIYSQHGRKFETSAMTIPAYDPNTLENTRVVLHHFGPDYFFDKVWIQGKNYGYEFPLPDNVKRREKERASTVSIAARYQATPPPATAPKTEAPAPAPQSTIAEAAPPPEAPAPAPAPAPPRELPKTAAGWLMMLLSGGTLSGVGLLLRRRR
jgi:LPXTG-motif cell wall-anchored protein